MAKWLISNTVLTKLGNKLLSYAVAGVATLNLTRVIVRETVSTSDINVKYDLNSVTNDIKQTGILLKYRGGVYNPETDDYDTSLITARFSNDTISDDTGSFKIRQIVLLASLTDIDTNAMLQYDPDFKDPGEVPYIVAQTTGEEDYDLMPSKSENPTSYDYDIYVVHTGTANITISIQKTGYVSEADFNRTVTEIKTSIADIISSKAGENTENIKFQVWTPKYTADDDPSGGRVWSKLVDESGNVVTTEFNGQKSAERFNMYNENANIATGNNCHVEGDSNVGISNCCHIEGIENHSGTNGTLGLHIEGRRNYATLGWFQHIEGEGNQSAGYVTHMEGVSNKALNTVSESVGILHVEGSWNTIEQGRNHHIEGEKNTIEQGRNHHIEGEMNTAKQGRTHHIEGKMNTVEQGDFHHIEGYSNSVTGVNNCNHVSGQLNTVNNCGESNVSGKENNITDCNQVIVSGNKNRVSMSEMANISGLSNTVESSPRASVSGTNNTVTGSKGTNISGDSNKVADKCFESVVSGYANSLTKSKHTVISGEENIVSDSDDSIYSGANNTINYALRSVVTGYNNSVGKSDTSDRYTKDSVISGFFNMVKEASRSVITGEGNKINGYSDPNGDSEEISTPINNLISGDQNTLNGIFSSVATGKSNIVNNIHDSLIGGKYNTISSEVPYTGTNCVLCVGRGCTVKNSGSPNFVTGSNNNISGSNSSVFGSDNIVSGEDQIVTGHYNIEDTSNKYALIVGGGTSSLNRKNILSLDWSGTLTVKDLILGDSMTSISARLTALENQVKQLLSTDKSAT